MVCDYAVIGGGASGCVVAARLSEDPNVRVVLLEAGGVDRNLTLHVPALALFATAMPRHNWFFETEPVPALGERRLRFSQGKGLGGSSSINGMIFMRGHAREHERWAQESSPEWSYASVRTGYAKAEAQLKLRPSRLRPPVCDAFLAAAEESGIPRVEDTGGDVLDGFGYYRVNIAGGRRMSAAVAYLVPARKRPNLTVRTSSPALRVVIEGGRATGVEVGSGSSRETIRVEREVIVCAGSLNSPQILMLSGIGPAEHLREHGIAAVVDAPDVGRNLQNHPAYRLRYACSQPVTAYSYVKPSAAFATLAEYLVARKGALAESFASAGGVFRTDQALDVADMIAVMAPALTRRFAPGGSFIDMLPKEHGFMVGAILGRPKSRGEIRLRSADPAQPPAIFPNYFAEPDDMRALVRGVQRLREIFRRAAIRKLIRVEQQPGENAADDRAVEEEIRARSETSFHPNGTCRMGNDAGAVVDASLRVRGVDGIRVADLSVMPHALCACTHGPALMVAEKAAELVRRGSTSP